MKLTHCVNGFIDRDEDMPNYGQLGCQGFIVLDAEHRVVSAATSPFMQVRDLAFAHVEALLDAVCAKKPLPKVCPGEFVTLDEAPKERPEFKGSRGICIKLDGPSVHFGFMSGPLQGRAMVVPATSVSPLTQDPAVGSCGSGNCSDGNCGVGGGCADGKCGLGGCGPGKCGDGGCGPGKCAPGSCGDGKCGMGAGCVDGKCGLPCAQGGCDGAGGCDGRGGCVDIDVVERELAIESVKVPSMDAEHQECAAALRRLAAERSPAALEAVLHCLQEHFRHEEALFVEYGFGAHANDKLSARKSHADDHERILSKVRGCLEASPESVAGSTVLDLLREFNEHTSRYDAQYAEPLSAKGAK